LQFFPRQLVPAEANCFVMSPRSTMIRWPSYRSHSSTLYLPTQ